MEVELGCAISGHCTPASLVLGLSVVADRLWLPWPVNTSVVVPRMTAYGTYSSNASKKKALIPQSSAAQKPWW